MLARLALVLSFAARSCAEQAPPYIAQMGVVNAASHVPPVLAGGGLAPGSRVHIFGLRLGPGSVELKQDGRHFQATVVSAAAGKVEAILPLDIAPGPADLTVTYDGQTSEPFRVRIVPRSFGISEVRQEGSQVRILGTGLGSTPAIGDVEVFVGGRPVRALRYAGPRLCCAGTDEIVFELPADAVRGCDVPIQVRVGRRIVSNVALLDIAEPGQPCAADWMRSASSIERQGVVLLLRARFQADLGRHTRVDFSFDAAAIEFADDSTGAPPILPRLPPLGTCRTITGVFEVSNVLYGPPPSALSSPFRPLVPPLIAGLDAGESIHIQGARGSRSIARSAARPNAYLGLLGGNPPLPWREPEPLYLDAGDFEISGAGGKDIGPFRATVQADPPLRWTDRRRRGAVDRARGVTVHWKAARADQIIAILVMNADQDTGAGAFCLCTAPASAGRFYIPPVVLANLPPTEGPQRVPVNFLALAALPGHRPAPFRARGLDAAFPLFVSAVGRTVTIR